MAITRLTDIITVFDSKWTYGDSKFGYEGEVNQDHDTQYPLMLIQPPESIIPVVYDGREEYTFEINFYNLYSQAAQDVVTLQKRWDNLQDLSNEWLDMVLKNYQDVTVADSGVTFDIPTKKVSAWADNSGTNNDMAQSTKANQPLRYGYGGQDDKAYFSFDGTSDYLSSDNNCPLTGNDLTIFYVAKSNEVTSATQRLVGYRDSAGGGSDRLNFGMESSGRVYFKALDDSSNGGSIVSGFSDVGTVSHIACARIKDTDFSLQYNNNTEVTANYASYSNNDGFNLAPFTIGHIDLGGVGTYWDGEIQEVIIYNRALSDAETADVRGYLNLKYNIY